jgi:hypothetical protein
MGRAAKNRRTAAWAGTGVALAGLLTALQTVLGAVHLRPLIFGLLTGMILIGSLLISVLQEQHARREAAEDLEGSLDAMLSCWPPRSASRLTPYDVGVHPDLANVGEAPAYVTRDRDADVDAALKNTGIAVVFGPAGSGKSRSAFEAVRRAAPDAAMVVPVDADALAKLMQQARTLPLFEDPTVLWLDGLERFAELLDVDPIDALVHPAPRKRWLWLRPPPPRMLLVVATVRDDALEKLLGDGDDASPAVRRLLSHARGVRLDERLSGNERKRFEDRYMRAPVGHSVGDAFPRRWSEGWERPVPRAVGPDEGGSGLPVWPGLLTIALAGLLIALAVAVHELGWTEPPDLKTQVNRLSDGLSACQRLEAFPKHGKGLESHKQDVNGSVLAAIVRGGDCPASDEVRFYRAKNDRLKKISLLAYSGKGARQTFSCIGEGVTDPCHARLAGSSSVIVGAFRDTETSQELPVAVSFAGEGLELSSLSPPTGPPRGIEKGIRSLNARQVTLPLRVGAAVPGSEECEPGRGCLKGRVAAATGVLGATGEHPAVLLAAYVDAGTTEAPEALKVRAWRINVPTGGAPKVQRERDCLVLVDGAPITLEPKMKPTSDPRQVMFASVRPKGAQLMC